MLEYIINNIININIYQHLFSLKYEKCHSRISVASVDTNETFAWNGFTEMNSVYWFMEMKQVYQLWPHFTT